MRFTHIIAALLLTLACAHGDDAPLQPAATAFSQAPSAAAGAASPHTAGATATVSAGADLRQAASPAEAPPGNPSPPPAGRAARTRTAPQCRATSLTGSIQRGGAPLLAGMTLSGPPALELAPGATLHLTHALSARQWSVSGPARLIACDDGAEEIVLARGSLRTEPGSGVRPGAEVWVGTPYGSLRYADASAELSVNERELRVQVSSGQVWFSPVAGDAAERPLSKGSVRFAASPHRLSSELARARCGTDAERAEQLAKALLGASTQPLGARAAEHVRARQRAHTSCASALAAALADDREPRPEAGYAALARYDEMWRAVPSPTAAVRATP
jgi:hypothetical protein